MDSSNNTPSPGGQRAALSSHDRKLTNSQRAGRLRGSAAGTPVSHAASTAGSGTQRHSGTEGLSRPDGRARRMVIAGRQDAAIGKLAPVAPLRPREPRVAVVVGAGDGDSGDTRSAGGEGGVDASIGGRGSTRSVVWRGRGGGAGAGGRPRCAGGGEAAVVAVAATASGRTGQGEVAAAAVLGQLCGVEAVAMAAAATARGRPGRGDVAAATAAAVVELCRSRKRSICESDEKDLSESGASGADRGRDRAAGVTPASIAKGGGGAAGLGGDGVAGAGADTPAPNRERGRGGAGDSGGGRQSPREGGDGGGGGTAGLKSPGLGNGGGGGVGGGSQWGRDGAGGGGDGDRDDCEPPDPRKRYGLRTVAEEPLRFHCSGCCLPPSPSSGNDGGCGTFDRLRRRDNHQLPVHHGDGSGGKRCRRRLAGVRRG